MLAVGYTETEETWIQHQFGQFQEQYMSVFPTSDYFKSLFHLLLWGTPVPESFVASWLSMVIERNRRVLKMHPGE